MMSALDETHEPALTSWVEGADTHSDFPVQNLPFGVFSAGDAPRGGVAIGDFIIDLAAVSLAGILNCEALVAAEAASAPMLNDLLSLGAGPRRALRRDLSMLLSNPQRRAEIEPMLHPSAGCVLHLPARIGDYTDFYVGIHHARNVGTLFRPDQPLLPNYKHLPIGYHGRASSVRVSGAEVVRPSGQVKWSNDFPPALGPTRRLDYELEMGAWIGPGSEMGSPIPIGRAADHVAGLCLLNDWSARDMQAWEYQPLGPFLAKNFLTTVSPWIVTAEALAPFRIAQPPRPEGDPAPLPYLMDAGDQAHGALCVELEVSLLSIAMRDEGLPPVVLSRGPASSMYWTVAQMVAHHTVGGCDLRSGDLLGTGTISGPEPDQFGSLLELSRGGAEPVTLPTGETRAFLEDGDTLAGPVRPNAPVGKRGRVGEGHASPAQATEPVPILQQLA